MIRFLFFRSILIVLLLIAPVTFAANSGSSTFIVRSLIGDDLVPPTTPTALTATPIAMSQINLSWSSSTDDYILSGYLVYRDNIQIATTTNTSYADVGLSASTTYTYYVTAYDSFNNISASSSLVATTTFATPTPPVAPGSGPRLGSKAHLADLVSLEIFPSQNGAIIRYATQGYIKSTVRWGRTTSYELGSSAERSFATFHEMAITDLLPGVTYRLLIEGEGQSGLKGILTETTFTTLPADDTTPPGNITNLRALQRGSDIILSWENPEDTDFDHVRVVRSTSFYPSDDVDGWVAYEDSGHTFIDVGVLTDNKRVYYTVFAYDHLGNISSGAVIAVGEENVPSIDTSKNVIDLNFTDLHFYQEDGEAPRSETDVLIQGGQYLTIALPYAAVPEHLKTILVTLSPSQNPESSFTFLLRINNEKTAYTARLAPFGVQGEYTLRMSVFDFKTEQIGYTEGTITSVISTFRDHGIRGVSFLGLGRSFMNFIMIHSSIIFIVLLLLLALSARRIQRARW